MSTISQIASSLGDAQLVLEAENQLNDFRHLARTLGVRALPRRLWVAMHWCTIILYCTTRIAARTPCYTRALATQVGSGASNDTGRGGTSGGWLLGAAREGGVSGRAHLKTLVKRHSYTMRTIPQSKSRGLDLPLATRDEDFVHEEY